MNFHRTHIGIERLAVVTFPFEERQESSLLLEKFLHILEPLAQKIYVITGNYPRENVFSTKITVKNIDHKAGNGSFVKVLKYAQTQFRIAFNVLKIVKKVDIVIFFIGGANFPAICIVKLFRKKAVIANTGSAAQSAVWIYKNNKVFVQIISILEKLGYDFSDRIVIDNFNLVKYFVLEKYIDKISIADEHFVNFDNFKISKSFHERGNIIGYIGRLSEEKGIMVFVKSIPLVINRLDRFLFIVGGDGPKREEVVRFLDQEKLTDKVKLVGWIPNGKITEYLNELTLLVVPSYTESMPNIILEAMACGTPVLANHVGGIPDVITDGINGFMMADNSPECISENINRVLNYPNLQRISGNASEFVRKKFSLEKAIERYGHILNELGN